jgi:4-hydroxy-3-polyprenylbenzoate decarboxylase
MAFADMREYLDLLEKEGELVRIKKEVDCNLEVGAIACRAQDLRAPAPLFENIKGYPEGFRLFGNTFGPTRPVIQGRVALALGLDKNTPTLEIINEYSRRLEKPIKPVLVDKAPCKENILSGDEVDLFKLPAPYLHEMDGGRFLGTWHINVIKDPDSDWVNWGTYRHMLLDRDSLGFLAQMPQHGPTIYFQKFEAQDRPMPMAIALGLDPLCNMAAQGMHPAYVSEVDMAGALRKAPVELVKCETCDLEVPAGSEIVLEGEVIAERRKEGPFAEFTGYCSRETLGPVFKVKCITFRNAPILPFTCYVKSWNDGGVMSSISISALLTSFLRKAGLPFKAAYTLPHALAAIISTSVPYPGYIHTLASAIWGAKIGFTRPYLIVVGEDVDVTDAEDVLWCMTTRLHPVSGVRSHQDTACNPLWPFLSRAEKEVRHGSKLLLNATFPANWDEADRPLVVDFETGWPAEIRRKVIDQWREYGY